MKGKQITGVAAFSRLGPVIQLPTAYRIPPGHCGQPSSYLCGYLPPPASLFYWNRASPVRLPLPIIPCVNARAHRLGGFGLRESLEQLGTEAAGSTNQPLVIIDELYRCRPTYAVECLERIKHLLKIPKIVWRQ